METNIVNLSSYLASEIVTNFDTISAERKESILPIINFIQEKVTKKEVIALNYICTHNSRRSQFSQIWSHVASHYYEIPNVISYSGGVEVTAFNERAVRTIRELGVEIDAKENGTNPLYTLNFGIQKIPSLTAFSKLYNDKSTKEAFCAIMTCDHADQNCPFIPNALARLPLRFEDPKAFDDTELEKEKYSERSKQIATELFYIFSQIKKA